MDFRELIEDNDENIFLDFKSEEYHTENKSELIKDVLAFANASYAAERFIIIGVSKDHTGIKITPVEKPEDSAAIQQYIHDNITPELNVHYASYNYDGKNLMVLTIWDTNNQPYYTKKTIYRGGKPYIKENDLWIRKGSRNAFGVRDDLEKIFKRRYVQQGLEGMIDLTFPNGDHELEIECIRNIKYPSLENKQEIQKQISEKEELLKNDPKTYQARYSGYYAGMGLLSYSAMDLQTLYDRLKTVEMNFSNEDKHYLNETRAYKLQFIIHNSGNKHLENGLVTITFPVLQGFTISNHIYLDTHQQAFVTGIDYQSGYPNVRNENDQVIVSHNIGEIRHRVPTEIYLKSLRIVPIENVAGQTVKITATIHGSNLPEPQKIELNIQFK